MHNKNFFFGSSSSGVGNDNARRSIQKLPYRRGRNAGEEGNGRNAGEEGNGRNADVEGNGGDAGGEGNRGNAGGGGNADGEVDLTEFQVAAEAPPPKARRETWTVAQNIALEEAYELHRNHKGKWEMIMQVPILKGHPKKSIQAKVRELKMGRSVGQAPGAQLEDKGKKWTEEQDQALDKAYSTYGNNLSQILQDPLLKGRPLRGIKAKIKEIGQAKLTGQQSKILGSSSVDAPKFPVNQNETAVVSNNETTESSHLSVLPQSKILESSSAETAKCPINQTETAGATDKVVPGVPNLSLNLLLQSENSKLERNLCGFISKNVGLIMSQVLQGDDMKEVLSKSVTKAVQTELTGKSMAQIFRSDEFMEIMCTCIRKVVREEMKREN